MTIYVQLIKWALFLCPYQLLRQKKFTSSKLLYDCIGRSESLHNIMILKLRVIRQAHIRYHYKYKQNLTESIFPYHTLTAYRYLYILLAHLTPVLYSTQQHIHSGKDICSFAKDFIFKIRGILKLHSHTHAYTLTHNCHCHSKSMCTYMEPCMFANVSVCMYACVHV